MKDFDLFQRIEDLLNPWLFRDKKVTVVGCGSGGSHIILELVKCGIGNITLIDKDTLSYKNVIRHVCGVKDVRRCKTDAVRDSLLNVNPQADISCYNLDILEDVVHTAELLSGSDLVIASTDNESSRFCINRICWEKRIPALYAYAFHRAFSGEAFLVIPGVTPCYACYATRLGHIEIDQEDARKPLDYSDPEIDNKDRSMPGLGMDIAMIAMLAAKLALIYLTQGTEYAMPLPPGNCVRWQNRPLDDTPHEYFARCFWQVSGFADCMVCGHRSDKNVGEDGDRSDIERMVAAIPFDPPF